MSDNIQDLLAADPAQLNYEQARDALATIVGELEGGSTSLEQSLALWEQGERLAQRCKQWLDDAEIRLQAATRAQAGAPDAGDEPSSDVPF